MPEILQQFLPQDSNNNPMQTLSDPEPGPQQFFSPAVQITLASLAVVSSIISLLLPALYYIQRKCRQHPAQLIAIISLLEALSNYNVILIGFNIYQFEHLVHISRIFDFLVFFRVQEPSETNFCEINFTIYILLELLSVGYNMAFSADLLITLKKPFFAGRRRMKFYHAFSLLFMAAALPMSIVEAEEICNGEFHQRSIYKVPKAFIASIGLFYVISSVIIVLSFTSVQSSQIRRRYIQLHRIILLTLMFLWVFPLLTNILILRGDQTSTLFQACNIGSFVSLLVSGGVINVVRFYCDPYTWQQIKNMVCQCRPWTRRQPVLEDDSGAEQEVIDIWNLPLANAVSTYHHQSVISNIIEIVLETCVNAPEELALKSSASMHEPKDYLFGSAVMKIKDIKRHLNNGSKEDIRRLTKIKKSLQMLCLERKEQPRNNSQKNIYKASDVLTHMNVQKGLNLSGTPDQLKIESSLSSKSRGEQKSIQNIVRDLDNKAITIKVQSYADPVFVSLRLMDNLTSEQLSSTLNLLSNGDNIQKARESLGASGSFFFFSFDNRLVIKTINQKQCEVFLRILPEYYEHIANNPHSLISRTYGLFSVEIAGISKIYFIMMENTLKVFEQNSVLYRRYDLKGSTIQRHVKDPNAAVLKDINYLKSDDAFLMMSAHRKKQLIEQVRRDISLLSSQNIMDYSLLLGVGEYKKIKKQAPRVQNFQNQQEGQNQWRFFDDGHEINGKVYSLSLIDYLQEYDWHKLMELKLKKLFKGGGDISSVDAKTYYDRFLKFISRIVVVVNY